MADLTFFLVSQNPTWGRVKGTVTHGTKNAEAPKTSTVGGNGVPGAQGDLTLRRQDCVVGATTTGDIKKEEETI